MNRNLSIYIGDKEFTIKKNSVSDLPCRQLSLYECYGIPSIYKQKIYDDWCLWARQNDVKEFGINSYNVHMFTLSGKIEIDGQRYLVCITKTRQELYKIV